MNRSSLVPYVNATDPDEAVLYILYVDEPLTLFDQHVVLQGVVQWDLFYETTRQIQIPPAVLAERQRSDAGFALALLMFMLARGVPLSRQVLVVQPAGDASVGVALAHAIRTMTGQFPLDAVRWIPGNGGLKQIVPALRNLEFVHASLSDGPEGTLVRGLIALMRATVVPSCTEAQADLVCFERSLAAFVPVFVRLRGRCEPSALAKVLGLGCELAVLVRSISNAPAEEARIGRLLAECGAGLTASLDERCELLAARLKPMADILLRASSGSAEATPASAAGVASRRRPATGHDDSH